MKAIKLSLLGLITMLVGIVLSSSNTFPSQAKSDEILDKIADYKTWDTINKTDEKSIIGFRVTDSSVAG